MDQNGNQIKNENVAHNKEISAPKMSAPKMSAPKSEK